MRRDILLGLSPGTRTHAKYMHKGLNLINYGSANTFSVNPDTIATYCLPSLPS
jgi:hypothetical protein